MGGWVERIYPRRVRSSLLFGATLVALACGSPSSGQEPWTTEEIEFQSRATTLVGTLYLPEGPGPHPVMVGGPRVGSRRPE